jgi:hypothetical protein
MPSGANSTEDQGPPCKEGLKQLIDLLKFTLALVTGTLVFSVGLLKEAIALNTCAKVFLLFSWLSLTASAAAGVLAYMRIPVLIAKQDYNFRDNRMEKHARFHQIAFIIGLLLLGVTLIIALFQKSGQPSYQDHMKQGRHHTKTWHLR